MKIVFTRHSEQPHDKIICQSCNKIIANKIADKVVPSFIECYKNGCIPVPNFGWICSQECAEKFEKQNEVTFYRDKEGKIDYYNGSLE